MDNKKEQLYFIIFAGVGLVISLFMGVVPSSLVPIGVAMGVIAMILAVAAFVVKDYAYLFEPPSRFSGRTITLDPNEPFYFSTNKRCVIVRASGVTYATSFLKVMLFKSSTEMSDEDKYDFSVLFSKAVSIRKATTRISSQLHVVDKDQYIQVITGKLNEAEDRYNTMLLRQAGDKNGMERVKGEVNMWHNLLDNVIKSNSTALTTYVTVTAVGGTEDEAVNIVTIESEELAAGMSAALGAPVTVVTGDEMLLFLEPEYIIPSTTMSEFMKSTR